MNYLRVLCRHICIKKEIYVMIVYMFIVNIKYLNKIEKMKELTLIEKLQQITYYIYMDL